MTTKQHERIERRSTRNHLAETKAPVTAERIRALRAEGVDWEGLVARFGRSKAGLQDIMSGRKKSARAKARAEAQATKGLR